MRGGQDRRPCSPASWSALFALNVALTGDWNYQGGERKTFYGAGDGTFAGGFPYQNDASTFDSVGLGRVGGGSFGVLFTRDALLEVFPHNLGYFLFGRHTGFALYFLPGLMAILLFLAATRDRAMWQWLTLAAGVITAVVLADLHAVHVVRRRRSRRQSLLPRHLRRVPVPGAADADGGRRAVDDGDSARCSWRRSSRVRSSRLAIPPSTAKTGMFRWLPTELTMVNDLPINVAPDRDPAAARRHAANARRISSTTTCSTARAMRSGCKGESSADILLRARIQTEADVAGVEMSRSLRIEKLTAILETGPKPNRVVISTGGDRRDHRHGAELAADRRAGDAARHAVQIRSALSDQLRLHA